MKTLYFSGGDFEKLRDNFSKVKGVTNVICGYVQSVYPNPDYDMVKSTLTDAAFAVKVDFDEDIIDVETLINDYLTFIDPTSLYKQGDLNGTQYRIGIYIPDNEDFILINDYISYLQPKFKNNIKVEIDNFENFTKAEDKYQK